MSVFLDTSALYAVLDADDAEHGRAAQTWSDLLTGDEGLIVSNSILVELLALVQRRLGMVAVRALADDVLPALEVEFATPEDHHAALAALCIADRRSLSFVDCSSFQVMRRLGLRRVFAFDRHFGEQGFEVLPQ